MWGGGIVVSGCAGPPKIQLHEAFHTHSHRLAQIDQIDMTLYF